MHRADNLTIFISRMSRNFGNFNILEPEGHVQACNAIDLKEIYVFVTESCRSVLCMKA